MTHSFYGQFLLTSKERVVPDGYHGVELNSWLIYAHKNLTVIGAYTLDNVQVGWVLGWLFSTSTETFVEDKLTFPFTANMPVNTKEKLIDQLLYQFGGRYICVILDKDIQRLYLDPAGSLSCVFSLEEQVLASTPGLIFDERNYYADLDEELYQLPDMRWYPSGLTPHTSVNRLLPNHYLNLPSWKPVRHWPAKGDFSCDNAISATQSIVEIIKQTIRTISHKFKVYLTLTAGYDSRTLLACSRKLVDDIQFVTFTEQKETVDEYIVKLLSNDFRLDTRFFPVTLATEEDKSRWLHATGHCVRTRILDIHRTLAQLDRERLILPGVGGELLRAFRWRRSDKEDTEISAKDLLGRFRLPIHKHTVTKTVQWLREIHHLNAFQILELATIEQLWGSWGGPQTYGQVQFLDHLYPFMHRVIFERILSMPPEYKINNRLPRYILELEWPELLEIPFNRFRGIRNLLDKSKKIKRIRSKLSTLARQKLER